MYAFVADNFERAVRRFASVATLAVGVAAIAVASFGNVAACRASISYPNQAGVTVSYEQITESSFTDPEPLYGAPLVSGDSIDFNPVLFNSTSRPVEVPPTSGNFIQGPADDTNGLLTFVVQANSGRGIRNLSLNEAGVVTVAGVGSNATYADISATGNLKILAIDGNLLSPSNIITIPIDLTFSHRADGTWELGTDGAALSLAWSGSGFFDLGVVLDANSIPYVLGATRVSIDLLNALHTQSEIGSIAFLDKKDFGGLSITVNNPVGAHPIPEPVSILAFLLVGLGPWFARRHGR